MPHVARDCDACGKTVHLAEPGEGGKGIRVRKGDRFNIPEGSLKISLDPALSSGKLGRHGLTWFVQMLLVGNEPPKTKEDLLSLLDQWDAESDRLLESSYKLKGLDIHDEKDGDKIIELVQKDPHSPEFAALLAGLFAAETKRRLESGDVDEIALWAVRAATAWSMLVFHRDLEKHVWAGYQHNTAIYGIAQASAQTSAEAEAISAVRPIFEKLNEDVLHAWIEAAVDIGPRIGVQTVDENLLKALAKFHLTQFERRRSEKQLAHENRMRVWTFVLAGFTAGAAVTTAVGGLLKLLGVL